MNTPGPAPLSSLQLGIASLLLLLNAALSVRFQLGIGKRLLTAAVRTVVQLTLLGYILVPVFATHNLWLTLGLGLLMVALAAREVLSRGKLSYRGAPIDSLIALSFAAAVSLFVGTQCVIQLEPWWQPRYFIPLLGMILGNTLTGMTLGLGRCLAQMQSSAPTVESLLALGATPWEASRSVVQDALRTGLIPIINSMSVVGLVTIPGMMTGQLLGGTAPALAARYQIMIMFLIAGSTAIGVTGAVLLAARRLFDSEARLRIERLAERQEA